MRPAGEKRALVDRTGLCLWFASVLGAVAVFPYLLQLNADGLNQAVAEFGIPLPGLLALSLVQSGVLLGFMTFAGLWAARKLGLGAPVLDALLNRKPVRGFQTAAIIAGAWGVTAAVFIIAVDHFIFVPMDPGGLGSVVDDHPAPWRGLLASFYGGITEEVQLRLFVLSMLALALRGLQRMVGKTAAVPLPVWAFWWANAVAAVLFGLGHLPATAELLPLTPLIVMRAIVLNGVVGMIAGVLYWRRGIEMAMVCHFCADLVLHVGLPLIDNP